MKERGLELTSRGGRSREKVVAEPGAYLRGWKAYFILADTPGIFAALDEWIRHRLRAIQLKHWRSGRTSYGALRKLGAADAPARRVAGNARRWWRSATLLLNTILNVTHFDRLGLPRLA